MKQIKMLSLMLNVLICATFLVATVQASESVVLDDQLIDTNHLGKTAIIVSTLYDNYVLKLDSNGSFLWATKVGVYSVTQAVENPTDKTIYAIGGDRFTKLSSDGAILLQKSISGTTIDVDPSDGSFYVDDYGVAAPTNKYDANGNFIKTFGSNDDMSAAAVYRADGSVYLNSYSAGVYKFDKNGNLLWHKQPISNWHQSYAFASLVVDQRDGSVVATAQDYGGAYVGYVVRFDTNGNTIWARPIHDLTYSRNAIDPAENVVYGAGADAGWAGDKLYKINLTNGDEIWNKSIGESPMTPSVDPFDGSIYVGKVYAREIVKVDKNGNKLWGPKNIGYYAWYLETTSDVDVTPVNLIKNPGFESGTAPWIFYTNGKGSFTTVSPGYEGNKAARLTIVSAGNNTQLYQKDITLEPNTRYRLSFAANSTRGHDMKVKLLKHVSPFTPYGLDQTFNLGTNWQEYSVTFTTTGFTSTVNNGRLMFYLVPFAVAGDKYYIDNVRLSKV